MESLSCSIGAFARLIAEADDKARYLTAIFCLLYMLTSLLCLYEKLKAIYRVSCGSREAPQKAILEDFEMLPCDEEPGYPFVQFI